MKSVVYIIISLILVSCGGSQVIETNEDNANATEQKIADGTRELKKGTFSSIESEIERQNGLRSGASSIEGEWNITVETPRGPQTNTIEIKRIDGQLNAVTSSGTFIITEQGDNNYVWENELDTPRGNMSTKNVASVNGNKISGKVEIISGAMSGRTLNFTGVRQL